MRILVVSNLYPPHYIGGYEIGCKDMVDALRQRGHDVEVLTSTYQLKHAESKDGVHRQVEFVQSPRPDSVVRNLLQTLRREINSQRSMNRLCRKFQPDIVYFWNLSNISISLAFTAENLGLPTAFYVFDEWLSHWESDRYYNLYATPSESLLGKLKRRLIRQAFSAFGLTAATEAIVTKNAQFCSAYIRDMTAAKGKPVTNNEVIHWGLPLENFPLQNNQQFRNHILFVGRVIPNKGVHVILEALDELIHVYHHRGVHLTVAGKIADPAYEQELVACVQERQLGDFVTFSGGVPRNQITKLYASHGILVFPSLWNEPFGITRLEAMAFGLPVVGTMTGGSPEICRAGYDALAYQGEDAKACAEQIHRLLTDDSLYHRIRDAARKTVETAFAMEQTVDKVEHLLEIQIASSKGQRTHAPVPV